MGKQINFYMTAQDELDFLHKLDALGPYKIYRVLTERPGETLSVSDLATRELEPLDRGQVALACDYTVPTLNYSKSLVNPKLPLKRLDLQYSEVIEFSRCQIERPERWKDKPPTITSGRLWYSETKEDRTRKGEDFIKWAAAAVSWSRRHYERIPSGSYLAPEAARLLRERKLWITDFAGAAFAATGGVLE